MRDIKFGKHRQVPMHPSTVARCASYAARPRPALPAPPPAAFFVTTRGTRLDANNLSHTFAGAAPHAPASPPRPGTRRPRLHDLRHSFATTTLLDWYRDGARRRPPGCRC